MEIIDLLRSHANEIKTSFAVKRIGLFGSFARGSPVTSTSWWISRSHPFATSWIFLFIQKTSSGKKVDLVTIKGLHPHIRPYVEKDVIWSK